MLALEGVPGLYIHSLLATQNDYERVELTRQNRSINRHKWVYESLIEKLENQETHHYKVFAALKALLKVRIRQAAFHPNAVQYTLHLGDSVFGFWRQSLSRDQSIFCLHNLTNRPVSIPMNSVNLTSMTQWSDLLSGDIYAADEETIELSPYGFVWLSNKTQT